LPETKFIFPRRQREREYLPGRENIQRKGKKAPLLGGTPCRSRWIYFVARILG